MNDKTLTLTYINLIDEISQCVRVAVDKYGIGASIFIDTNKQVTKSTFGIWEEKNQDWKYQRIWFDFDSPPIDKRLAVKWCLKHRFPLDHRS